MTPDDKLIRRIAARLSAHRGTRAAAGVLLILIGIPLCFIAPLILGSIFWWVAGALFSWWRPWTWFFGALAVITIPMLIRLERRTAGRYLDTRLDALAGGSDEGYLAAVAADHALGARGLLPAVLDPVATSAGFVSLFLVGPRSLLTGINQVRSAQAARKIDLNRAAAVIATLAASSRGLPATQLLQKGEDRADLRAVLQYLSDIGWLGVAADESTVYLHDDARSAAK